MSSLPESIEMPRGCLFPDHVLNRDVSQRYLAKLIKEGSYSIGGFHCLPRKDRVTWDSNYTVYIYYIPHMDSWKGGACNGFEFSRLLSYQKAHGWGRCNVYKSSGGKIGDSGRGCSAWGGHGSSWLWLAQTSSYQLLRMTSEQCSLACRVTSDSEL